MERLCEAYNMPILTARSFSPEASSSASLVEFFQKLLSQSCKKSDLSTFQPEGLLPARMDGCATWKPK